MKLRHRGLATLCFGAVLCGGLAAASPTPALGAPAEAAKTGSKNKAAEIGIEGLGWLRDISLRRTLVLLLGRQRGATMDASAIEDAALILYSTLNREGYLEPTIRARVTVAGKAPASYPIDPKLENPLPRPLAASAVEFQIRRGRRSTLSEISFSGLHALKETDAKAYFRGEGVLAAFTADQAYAPDRLQRSLGNLVNELRRRGYAQAEVSIESLRRDPATAKTRVRIRVEEGPLWRVSAVRYAIVGSAVRPPADFDGKRVRLPWSDWWRRDWETAIRRLYFKQGYPDVRVHVTAAEAPPSGGERAVTAVARVTPGPLVRLGKVRFAGNARMPESVLRPLVHAQTGDPLDPQKIQEGQYRISRLGVFSAVDVRYEPARGKVRDVVYVLSEGKRQDVDLLLGWGSFDLLRGGVEWSNYNLFDRAHEGTLKFIQSLRSTQGEYDYSVPELFGTSVDGSAKLFGFKREERAFLDEQYGANFSLAVPLPGLGSTLLTGYTFDRLDAGNDTLATEQTDLTRANATSVSAALTRDRRDNPLLPRHGYKLFAEVQVASRLLGGQVDFQEFQFGASYHTPWGSSRWIHLGFSHSAITTWGAPAGNELPPNVLFYPGGDDSIRGYGLGQAAPRGPDGQYLGARAVTLVNVELEQALTSKWSLVVFSDSVATAANIADYPFDQELYSVGLGVRYQTIVGPLRLEYGRNLNPRPHDPQGTVLFSVGFPF